MLRFLDTYYAPDLGHIVYSNSQTGTSRMRSQEKCVLPTSLLRTVTEAAGTEAHGNTSPPGGSWQTCRGAPTCQGGCRGTWGVAAYGTAPTAADHPIYK